MFPSNFNLLYEQASYNSPRKMDYEKLTAYIRFYSFVSQIIPYSDRELEMLYSFGRFLLPNLGDDDTGVSLHPETQVTLEYYRMADCKAGDCLYH